jgi:hypothetical protein
MRCANTRTTLDKWGICRELPPRVVDKESTEGRGFHRELPGHRPGIHPMKGIPAGITSLFTRI